VSGKGCGNLAIRWHKRLEKDSLFLVAAVASVDLLVLSALMIQPANQVLVKDFVLRVIQFLSVRILSRKYDPVFVI
jgi:hypothetical protein